jgi:hypothetical protein
LPTFGEKIGVFLKNQCYDQFFFKKLAVVCAKKAIFANFFRRKYYKNHNIGPRETKKVLPEKEKRKKDHKVLPEKKTERKKVLPDPSPIF